MSRKSLLVVVLFALYIVPLFANSGIQQALPLLDADQVEQLLKRQTLNGSTIDGGKITQFFVPGTEAYARAKMAESATNGFSIAAVCYIPYGPKLKQMTTVERQLSIFNHIRAISTQEGLMYISWRAGNKPKLLIEKSSYMEDEKNLNTLLADPIASTLPTSIQSYVYQRDSSFGGNRYLHNYTNNDQEIFVEIKNLSAMKVFGLITAVPKEQLSINMGTYQMEDGLLLVALTTITDRDPTINIFGLSVDLPSAFMRRITALQNWFIARLDSVETV